MIAYNIPVNDLASITVWADEIEFHAHDGKRMIEKRNGRIWNFSPPNAIAVINHY